MAIRFKFAGIVIAVFLSLSGLAHAKWPVSPDNFSHVVKAPAFTLKECCPRPKWWNNVKAPTIKTKAELLTIWQNRNIDKKIKAKAFFRAIKSYDYKDDDLVATAISLYPFVDGSYPHLVKLLEYGVGRFFNHNRSLVRYQGKIGDTSAGLVRKLATKYVNAGQPQKAAALISTLIRDRGNDINQQLLERLSLTMIDALKSMGKNELAYSVATYAIDNYTGDWEKNLKKKREALRPSLTITQQVRLSLPNSLILIITGFIGLIILFGAYLWSRRGQQNYKAESEFRYGRN